MQKAPQQMKRRIRRSKAASSPNLRLVRVALYTVVILVVCVLLFEMDHFTRTKSNKLGSLSKSTPEHILLQQQEQKLLRQKQQVKGSPAAAVVHNQTKVTVATHSHPPRLVMTLGGLAGLEETKTVIIELRPDWAPLGVAHLLTLVEQHHFYDECRFFRVIPNFVAQFGIHGTPAVQKTWSKVVLKDDPVTMSNRRGTISYATSGPNTRTTQLFINYKDNKYLDKEGFAPIGEIVEGMEWVDKIYSEYREKPGQGKLTRQGNDFLKKEFPKLSYIVELRRQKQDTEEVAVQ